jgi:hypothetical protein
MSRAEALDTIIQEEATLETLSYDICALHATVDQMKKEMNKKIDDLKELLTEGISRSNTNLDLITKFIQTQTSQPPQPTFPRYATQQCSPMFAMSQLPPMAFPFMPSNLGTSSSTVKIEEVKQ